MHDRLPPNRVYSASRDLFNFLAITDNNFATVQDADSYNGRLIGNHFSCLKPFLLSYLGKYSTYSHKSGSVDVATTDH